MARRADDRQAQERKTLEREAQLERFRQRVFEAFDPLIINAQLSLALGLSYLFKLDTDGEGRPQKPILITDLEEIRAYLAGDYNKLDLPLSFSSTRS